LKKEELRQMTKTKTEKIEEKVREAMKGTVAHWKKATSDILAKGYYWRGRCFGRPVDGGRPGHIDIYVWNADTQEVETLCFNTTCHRAKTLLRLWLEEREVLKKIDPVVLENYIHNGHLTRAGLFRSRKIKRMQRVADSHAEYVGNETGDSLMDHLNRVRMRN